jgi:hypothetical protein
MAEALTCLVADLIDIDPRAVIDREPRLIDIVFANDGFRVALSACFTQRRAHI